MRMPKSARWGAEVTKTLQQAIRDSDFSQSEVARRAGIDVGQVSRFLRGERGMTLATAAKVADVLGLDLRLVRKARARAKG